MARGVLLSPESSQIGPRDQTHEGTAQGEAWAARIKELREEGEVIVSIRNVSGKRGS